MLENQRTNLPDMHPTKATLVAYVVACLENQQPGDIGVDEVLRSTGVSRGSLYHHFENFDHLIETAMAVRYAQSIDETIDLMRTVLERSTTRVELMNSLKMFNRYIHTADRRSFRLERARILAAAEGKPRFEAIVGRESSRLTSAMVELVEAAVSRGVFQSRNDSRAVAVFMQAYTLGRIVDDFNVENPVDTERWIELLDRVLGDILMEPED